MTKRSVTAPPFPIIFDASGRPLDDGRVWIGLAGSNAKVAPITVYWDEDLVYPAEQPIRTLNGYLSRDGTPGQLFSSADFSMHVEDKQGRLVYSVLRASPLLAGDKILYTADVPGSPISRTIDEKFAERRTVTDFGPVGTSNDSATIQAALDWVCLNGSTLYFPPGEYLIGTALDSTISALLPSDAAVKLVGENAVLKATATGMVDEILFRIETTRRDLEIDGLVFDGNVQASRCFDAREFVDSSNRLLLNNCTFKNSWQTGASDSAGAVISGGWDLVQIDKCLVQNCNRAVGAGTPNSTGTNGIIILANGSAYAKRVNVTKCEFDTITNSETTTNDDNVDVDGLSIFGIANGASPNLEHRLQTATVTGCHFKNVKGRDIKLQNDKTVIDDCHFYRNIAGIGTSADDGSVNIGAQEGSCEVTNSTFTFEDEDSGEPTLSRPTAPISFFNSLDTETDRLYIVANCRVFNNVTHLTLNRLDYIVDARDSPNVLVNNKVMNITSVTVVGKVEAFLGWPPSASGNGVTNVTVRDCYVDDLLYGIAAANGSTSETNNFLLIDGFTHGDGSVSIMASYAEASFPVPLDYAGIQTAIQRTIGVLTQRDIRDSPLVDADPSGGTQRGFPANGISPYLVNRTLSQKNEPTVVPGSGPANLRAYTVILGSTSLIAGDAVLMPINPHGGIALISLICNFSKNTVATFTFDANGTLVVADPDPVIRSPDGNPWRVAVDNAGVLSAVTMAGLTKMYYGGSSQPMPAIATDPGYGNICVWSDNTTIPGSPQLGIVNYLASSRQFTITVLG